MLFDQGIRTKLLAVLALPILALVIVSGVVSVQAFGQAARARQVQQLAEGSGVLGRLVSSLQSERTVSVAYLQGRPVKADLRTSWISSDTALAASRALIGSVDLAASSPQATAAVAQADRGHAELTALRASVSGGVATAPQVAERYAAIIGNDIALPQRIGEGLTDRAIGSQLTAYAAAQQLAELATQERETGLSIIAARGVDAASGSALAKLTALQNQTVDTFRFDATSTATAMLDTALNKPAADRASYRDLQRTMLAAGTGRRVTLDSSAWRNVSNDRISALQALPAPIAATASELAAAAASSARLRALGVLTGGGLLVALLVLLGSVLSRTITRPLRHLTEVAGHLRDELPRMVERMATPGEGPGVQTPDIPVGARDEVGQLARAFRDVNATTVRVAEEQAALRASIAETFVNVARRNHVLLSRQLSFIDQLERTEENPDTLENLFKLDHLATRMRRNAESLIVLAGIDSGRRLRRPMPLSDVIRTAVSEIERYDRVDLTLQADPPMIGHVALTAAHLLAELLENATQFSNPDTRVVTSTTFGSHGVRVTITDLGLGMTWDEISDANERIANPPMSDVVGSQRLGYYVVGRLAGRLDASVELSPGLAQGTIVTVDLPPALFMVGTVVEVDGGRDDASAPSPGPDDVPGQPVPVGAEVGAPFPPTPTVMSEPALAAAVPAVTAGPPARGSVLRRFRARREATPPASEPTAAGSTALADRPSIQDSATTFVPMLHPPAAASAPDLPQRDLPQRGTAPAAADNAAAAIAPGPLDDGWVPAASSPATEPALLLEPVREPAPAPAPIPAGESAPEVDPQPAVAEATEPGAHRPPVGVASMDILPSRSPSRGLRLRRPGRATSVPVPPTVRAPAPATAAPVPTPTGQSTPQGAARLPDLPSVFGSSSPDEPFAGRAAQPVGAISDAATSDSAEAPVPPSPPAPIAAPPSLFATAASSAPATSGPATPDAVQTHPATAFPTRPDTVPVLTGPVVPALAAAQSLRERSAIASQALSELSALSTYRPETLQAAPAGLVRRTPQATPAGQLPTPPQEPSGARRPNRNAADVRSMLSGFQAGVARGRTSPDAVPSTDEDGE